MNNGGDILISIKIRTPRYSDGLKITFAKKLAQIDRPTFPLSCHLRVA